MTTYDKVLFRGNRKLLYSELNEAQQVADKQASGAIRLLTGSTKGVHDLAVTPSGLNAATVDGLLYAFGRVFELDAVQVAGIFQSAAASSSTLYAQVTERVVTGAEDPELLHPVLGEPCADRIVYDVEVAASASALPADVTEGDFGTNTVYIPLASVEGSTTVPLTVTLAYPISRTGDAATVNGKHAEDFALRGVSAGGLPNLLDPKRMAFTRASVAYKKDGSQVPFGVLRTEQGKYGQAAFIEEGTTNLLKNARFQVYTGGLGIADGWNFYRDPAHTTTFLVEAGRQRINVTASTAGAESMVHQTYTAVSAGQTYTASAGVDVQAVTGSVMAGIRMEFQNASGTILRYVEAENLTAVGKKRLVVTEPAPAGATQVVVIMRVYCGNGSTANAYFDNVQLEQKAYATSFIGASDTTTQAVRQPESLSYTLPQTLPNKHFGCLVWNPAYASSSDANKNPRYPILATATDGNGSERYRVQFVAGFESHTCDFRLSKFTDGTTNYTVYSTATTFEALSSVFLAWKDDPDNGVMALYVGVNDDPLQKFTLSDSHKITDVKNWHIGGYLSAGFEANGTIDFPIISNVIPTDEQIEALYRAGTLSAPRDFPNPTQLLKQVDWLIPALTNSWTNYGSGDAAAAYYKNTVGEVKLKGTIKCSSTTLGTVILTLPVGYRPLESLWFNVIANDGTSDKLGRLRIDPNGTMSLWSGGTSYVYLNGISFRAEQ